MHRRTRLPERPTAARSAPDFLTVEEAACVLRIGRTSACQLAREHLASGGTAGLPVVRVGKLLRIPRCELERLLGGRLTWPALTSAVAEPSDTANAAIPPVAEPRLEQPSLPFSA